MKTYSMQYCFAITYFFAIAILLSILSASLTACQRGAGSNELPDVGLEMSISPKPLKVGLATVSLDLRDSRGKPITGANIELESNMSHAGMVPSFSQATEIGNGRYEAPLEFTMGGDWFILLKADLPDGRQLERQIDVPGVETP